MIPYCQVLIHLTELPDFRTSGLLRFCTSGLLLLFLSLESGVDFLCSCGHLVVAQLDVMMEVDVSLRVDRNEMDVGMVDFESQHHLGHLLTGESRADGLGNLLGKHLKGGEVGVAHVKDVVHFLTRYNQRMALFDGIDVEEGIEVLILGAFVAGYLTSSDFAK